MNSSKQPVLLHINIDITIVPSKTLPSVQGSQPPLGTWDALPSDLREKLMSCEYQILKWLSDSPENINLFDKDPIQALQSAGVNLTRAESKLLAKEWQIRSKLNFSAPGVEMQIKSITVDMKPKKPNIH